MLTALEKKFDHHKRIKNKKIEHSKLKLESIKNKIWSLQNFGKLKIEQKYYKKYYVYNIFTINSKKLLLLISGQKNNFSGM